MRQIMWSDVEFGPKSYNAMTGVTKNLIALGFLLLFATGLALALGGWLSIVLWVLVAILTWTIWGILYGRLSKPWRRHHYPLRTVLSWVMGAMYGRDGHMPSFQEWAPALLKAAFPLIDDRSIRLLIERCSVPLFDAFNDLGVINGDIPQGDARLDEFRSRLEEAEIRDFELVRRTLLFAMIIGAHEGPHQASLYALLSLHGDAR